MQLTIAVPSHVTYIPDSWDFLLDRAKMYERVGVDGVGVSEHVVFGEHLEAYASPELGGRANAVQPTSSDGSFLDPLIALTAISSVTSRIRLQTYILLAAIRRPIVLAKAAASLDVLSKGRFDMGVGVGWQREEYEAAGLEFEGRGELLDRCLEVCQVLWREQRASYSSPLLSFENIHMMPKPVDPMGVPVWCSGRPTKRVAARVAKFATGWFTWDLPPDTIADAVAEMRVMVTAAGGDGEGMLVQAPLDPVFSSDKVIDVPATLAVVPGLVRAGVTHVNMYRPGLPDDIAHSEEQLTNLVASFRDLVGREPATVAG
jgi:probable F420-dependent oxidoreductase